MQTGILFKVWAFKVKKVFRFCYLVFSVHVVCHVCVRDVLYSAIKEAEFLRKLKQHPEFKVNGCATISKIFFRHRLIFWETNTRIYSQVEKALTRPWTLTCDLYLRNWAQKMSLLLATPILLRFAFRQLCEINSCGANDRDLAYIFLSRAIKENSTSKLSGAKLTTRHS